MSTKTEKNDLLPSLTDHKGYKEALKQQKKAAAELEKAKGAVKELRHDLEEADVAGANHNTLRAIEDKIAAAKRDQELADRWLQETEQVCQEQRKAAEAKIKQAAQGAGKKIVNKILKALAQLERGQKEYPALERELRKKVRFEKPLSRENSGRYVGPDPAYIFSAYTWPVIGYKETAERYIKDWPEPSRPKERKYEPPNQIILG